MRLHVLTRPVPAPKSTRNFFSPPGRYNDQRRRIPCEAKHPHRRPEFAVVQLDFNALQMASTPVDQTGAGVVRGLDGPDHALFSQKFFYLISVSFNRTETVQATVVTIFFL
ncbi:MAG: hypothetical protein JNN30_06315 [Rhodanobacteraceae bacterium]|nr:hypothetical protein [Rhodanobacteraceae bacterium]